MAIQDRKYKTPGYGINTRRLTIKDDMQKRNVSSIKPAMESAATTTSEQEPKMPPIDLACESTRFTSALVL